jgi:hypothetical protein
MKKKGIVYRVGINDADYVVTNCLYYRKWKQMLRRCYSSSYQVKNSSYIGCIVCEEWKHFSNFKMWMMSQDWGGKELDKDILFPDNKVYSPDTCVFVNKEVNELFSKKNKHGVFGIHYSKLRDRYILRSSTVGGKKPKYSGCYVTLEEARVASNQMRRDYIREIALKQKDDRVKDAILNLLNYSEKSVK